MIEHGKQERPTLEGDAALNLWCQGRDAWNSWISANPRCDIRFDGVDFSDKRHGDGVLRFAGYKFGRGTVSFIGTKFGKGGVSFKGAKFGKGDFHFMEATFCKGNIDFSDASFGNGDVNFFNTDFGNGDLDFSRVSFGKGNVRFSKARFGEGNVSFLNANFGGGNIDFYRAVFSGPAATFSQATFGKGRLDFSYATFGKGVVDFSMATFDDSYLNFFLTSFGDGVVNFSESDLGDGTCNFFGSNFDNTKIHFDWAKLANFIFQPKVVGSGVFSAEGLSVGRTAELVLPRSATALKSFNLQSASFDGPLTLKGNLETVPDLRGTKSSHQVELSRLNIKLCRIPMARNWFEKFLAVAEDHEDAARLRRLKEIAETNKDHQAALRFSADENRARRWIETSWLGSVLDVAFSGFSDYGQNILRPSLWLGTVFLISTGLYKALAAATFAAFWKCPGWGQSLLLSLSNSLPFLPQSRDLREDALDALYPGDPSFCVDALMIGQGVFSFAFLFLIGLGLRNRFRL